MSKTPGPTGSGGPGAPEALGPFTIPYHGSTIRACTDRSGSRRPGPNAVERPHLTSAFAERFDRRLVTVEEGTGFGTTTLLPQALGSGNAIDAYISCDSGDATPSRLLGAVLTALGSPPGDDTLPSVDD